VGVWIFYPRWNGVLRSWGRHLAVIDTFDSFQNGKTANCKYFNIKPFSKLEIVDAKTRETRQMFLAKSPGTYVTCRFPSYLDWTDFHTPWDACSISMLSMPFSTWGYSVPRNANDSVPLSPPLLHTPRYSLIYFRPNERTRTTSLQCRSSACPERISHLDNTLKSDLEEERHGLSILVCSRNLPFIRISEERTDGWIISLMITLLRWSPIHLNLLLFSFSVMSDVFSI